MSYSSRSGNSSLLITVTLIASFSRAAPSEQTFIVSVWCLALHVREGHSVRAIPVDRSDPEIRTRAKRTPRTVVTQNAPPPTSACLTDCKHRPTAGDDPSLPKLFLS